MKNFKIAIVFILTSTSIISAQENDSTSIFPNIEYDILKEKNSFHDFYFKLGIFNLTGLGIKSTFHLPKNFYTSVNLEFGATGGMKFEPEFSTIQDNNLSYNIDIRGGYTIFSNISKKERKWVSREDSRYRYYYNIDVPIHRELCIEGGYSMNPSSHYLVSENRMDTASINFFAPVLNIGVRWKSYIYSIAKVIDKNTEILRKGKFKGFSEIYVGIIVPLKSQIDSPESLYIPMESDKIGINILLKMPGFSNTSSSFFIQYSSTGYGNAKQYTLGYSWNLGFMDKKYMR